MSSDFLFKLRYSVANHASYFPAVYTFLSKSFTGRDCYTTKDTDIVIDGYPRSANTYATCAFELAQSKKIVIANHIHKKSQFLLAEKYNIPAILLIRNPLDCISSLLIRQPKYDPVVLFQGYYLLYNGLKNSDGFVVGDFDNVINDYAKIIKCVNNKFGKNFNLYNKTEENENIVRHIVQNQDELKNAADYGERVAYPNEDRKKMLTEIK